MVKKGVGDDSFVDKPEPTRLSSNERVYEGKEGIPSIHSKPPEPSKRTMTDDEIMLFNEELMAKINKREVQPLEEPSENEITEQLKRCEVCKQQMKILNNYELISEFVEKTMEWIKICNMWIDGGWDEDWKDNLRNLRDEIAKTYSKYEVKTK
ncbi:MAG TPA: hypothetical protein VMV43_03655 [Candidatus Nanopelagicaceae bacterium]|nr:hypothetical protein [Candidatus Nanopelagicaceae bacterium]